jgi:PAS domain S-box-containing protein
VVFVRESARAVKGADGRVQFYDGVVEDFTDRKRTEEALGESEERFRNMADTAPVMIWVSNTEKQCTFFNKTWLEFTGRTLNQELGAGWTEGVHPDDLDRCFESYCSSFDARRQFNIEYRLRRADGEYRWMLCRGVPRFEPGGVFAGYIGSDVDITDLRRAQEEIFERQKLESLGVLTGGIAHDFNNFLGSILAAAELAETNMAVNSSPGEEIRISKGVALRASEIVRELMIYSGQDTASRELVDVSGLVEEMLELLKVSISKHAVLKTDLPRNLDAVRGNAAQIRQIVMNLIINASEAIGDKDGVIRVSTSRVNGAEIAENEGGRLPECDYARLEVSDTGCGMTPQVQARVFDPFFTTKFAGRGLGLAVVQGIVRAHGGALNLVSTPSQGTTFQILLPCADELAHADFSADAHAPAEQIAGAPKTVLLVEDENTLRLSVSKMLRKKGFSVIEAADGSTAINLIRARREEIDVILLDMTIPGSSSSDVIAEATRIRPEIKIILTTAYSRETATPTMNAPQLAGFIRKPFQLGDLVQLLRDTIS